MTNLQRLRNVIENMQHNGKQNNKVAAALRLCDSVKDDFRTLAGKISAYNDGDTQLDDVTGGEFNSDFVGLDTIEWRLEKGNLKIQERMERFISNLKQDNGAGI